MKLYMTHTPRNKNATDCLRLIELFQETLDLVLVAEKLSGNDRLRKYQERILSYHMGIPYKPVAMELLEYTAYHRKWIQLADQLHIVCVKGASMKY